MQQLLLRRQKRFKTPGAYSVTYYYYFNGNAAAAGNDYEAAKTVT